LNCLTVEAPLPKDMSKPRGCRAGCWLTLLAVGVAPETLRLTRRAVGDAAAIADTLRAVTADTFLWLPDALIFGVVLTTGVVCSTVVVGSGFTISQPL
jgi:hypothetical protein